MIITKTEIQMARTHFKKRPDDYITKKSSEMDTIERQKNKRKTKRQLTVNLKEQEKDGRMGKNGKGQTTTERPGISLICQPTLR